MPKLSASRFRQHFCLVLAIPLSVIDIASAFASSTLLLPLIEDSRHAGHVENQSLGIVVVRTCRWRKAARVKRESPQALFTPLVYRHIANPLGRGDDVPGASPQQVTVRLQIDLAEMRYSSGWLRRIVWTP